MPTRRLTLALAFAALGTASSANALVVGTASDSANCFPFGCSFWTPTYQQVYDASAFGNPLSITLLSFYRTQETWSNGTPNSGAYTFTLSTTAAAVDGLSASAAANLGGDALTVFTGALPSSVAAGGRMDIILDTAFDYDPQLGNLLLSITATGLASPSGNLLAFDMANSSADPTSRLYMSGLHDTAGLVTGFNEGQGLPLEHIESPNPMPEPTSLALLGLSLAGLVGSRRLRK